MMRDDTVYLKDICDIRKLRVLGGSLLNPYNFQDVRSSVITTLIYIL